MAHHYPPVKSNPSFPEIEKEVLERWKAGRIFERSIEERPRIKDGASNEFVFYDGPPFANGLPHYGHLVTGFVKDLVPRYQTMRGHHVERRFGWDCHGLPAELEVEKELGVSGREKILDYGMAEFNDKCRESVQRYTSEWEWYVTRAARWVSFDDDYKTMDMPFMESVIWAFKTLWDKGLVYEGHRVVPYSWAVQTPLSNFETRLDNSYRERDDPALTVRFRLEDEFDGEKAEMWAWTTTPWTLPSNLALCVNADLPYAVMRGPDGLVIIASDAVERHSRELEGFEETRTVAGRDLEGLTYRPLFPYFAGHEGAFRVLVADFVGAGDGTGVVHMAPGFGEDDLEVSSAAGIEIVVPVDAAGAFTDQVPDYAGQNVIHEANGNIIRDLKAQGSVVRHEQYRHNYPHCWRTDEPLIYRAVKSWYIKVSAISERMVELNAGIDWTPSHVRDGIFGNWLANARDWNVSRNRFWGSPIPVWQSDDPDYPRTDVYGSLDELERDFGVRPADLHRPAIDELTRPNPDDPTGNSTMCRVPDVLDCWFESGSMPFAQHHYPFENQDRFEANFPGDFIVEYVAQTRGWFYTMMVLATALFDRAPFRHCICHGVVLDENMQKLSKRLQNYPDPVDVFETYGADALRWHMLSSPLMSGGNMAMQKDGKDIARSMRSAILRLWNAFSFFTTYANAGDVTARLTTGEGGDDLDHYLLAKTRELVANLEDRLDNYDIPAAYDAVPGFVDALNNWYIRSKRRVFWAAEKDDATQASFDALYTSLVTTTKALAPLLPFVSDYIHHALTGEDSVHLTDWPDLDAMPANGDLLAAMDLARDVCASVLALREDAGRRVRLPLPGVQVAHPDAESLSAYSDLIADAVNVKTISLGDDVAQYGSREVKVDSKIGRRIGAKMKDVLAAQRAGEFTIRDDDVLEIGGVELPPNEYELRIAVADGISAGAIDRGTGIVVLDTEVRADLQREGWARDIIRTIQQARKDAGLHVSDRIRVDLSLAPDLAEAQQEHADRIASETLAKEVSLVDALPNPTNGLQDKIDGQAIAVAVTKL